MVSNYMDNHFYTIIFIMLALQATMPYADLKSRDALLRFKKSLSNTTALKSWDPITPPCFGGNNNWVGLTCSKGGNVYGLRLEIMGLSGKLDVSTLSPIRKLRSISFMNNKLNGLIPNVNNLKALKSIYLSNNMFEGTIDPEFFRGMKRLRKLHLSNNKFAGCIPISLTKLPKLIELRLDGNQLEGYIPNLTLTSFSDLSLANNKLSGIIPISLSRLSPETFSGNKGLCGAPLKSCENSRILPNDNENGSKKPIPIIPIVVAMLLLFILLAFSKTIKRNSRRNMPRIKSHPVDIAPKKQVNVVVDGQSKTTVFYEG